MDRERNIPTNHPSICSYHCQPSPLYGQIWENKIMKYDKNLQIPKSIDRKTISFTKYTEFTPKCLATNLKATIHMASEMALKHYSYQIVKNRCDSRNIILYNNKKNTIYYNNNITRIATKIELSTMDWDKRFTTIAKKNHYPDIHLYIKPTQWKRKYNKGWFYIQSCIGHSK